MTNQPASDTDTPLADTIKELKAEITRLSAEREKERDGNWIDKQGSCKVCGGEIPYGHTNNCDIWKLEQIAAESERKRKEMEEKVLGFLTEAEREIMGARFAIQSLRQSTQTEPNANE